jgi:F-type H+-transporting ATPase subunit b
MAAEAYEAAGAHGADKASSGFPPFDASLFTHQIIWWAIAFGALYWVMSRVALPRVKDVLDARAAKIRSDLDAASAAQAKAETARHALEKAQAEGRAQARRLVDDMRSQSAADIAAAQAAADADGARKIAAAEERLAAMRAGALADIRVAAAGLAGEIAAKLGSVAVSDAQAKAAVEKAMKGSA